MATHPRTRRFVKKQRTKKLTCLWYSLKDVAEACGVRTYKTLRKYADLLGFRLKEMSVDQLVELVCTVRSESRKTKKKEKVP